MKVNKSKHCTRLTDDNLENSLRLCISGINPNIDVAYSTTHVPLPLEWSANGVMRRSNALRPFLLLPRVPILRHCDAFVTNFTAAVFPALYCMACDGHREQSLSLEIVRVENIFAEETRFNPMIFTFSSDLFVVWLNVQVNVGKKPLHGSVHLVFLFSFAPMHPAMMFFPWSSGCRRVWLHARPIAISALRVAESVNGFRFLSYEEDSFLREERTRNLKNEQLDVHSVQAIAQKTTAQRHLSALSPRTKLRHSRVTWSHPVTAILSLNIGRVPRRSVVAAGGGRGKKLLLSNGESKKK
ncbi:hypothetical protein EVAR_18583_1 [Eumeta japonica]|uniref:Uncharacterized protein n=1 Tax=Eumeta variegata TaxID=151549 RepID=A0A4C1V2Q4_EUMVA|nr:hypothetical protein EVAR_18583_1 [Eumeta japonica]